VTGESSPDVESSPPLEATTHSFVIRLWLEHGAGGHALWRGHITHVPSGARRYIQDLDGISAFIAPYLEALGTRLSLLWRIRRARRRRPRSATHQPRDQGSDAAPMRK
jgi:hypothetical protein